MSLVCMSNKNIFIIKFFFQLNQLVLYIYLDFFVLLALIICYANIYKFVNKFDGAFDFFD